MHAVLNANYLRMGLRDCFRIPYDRPCLHEFVCEGQIEGSPVRALDIAKRLIDYAALCKACSMAAARERALGSAPRRCASASTSSVPLSPTRPPMPAMGFTMKPTSAIPLSPTKTNCSIWLRLAGWLTSINAGRGRPFDRAAGGKGEVLEPDMPGAPGRTRPILVTGALGQIGV